MNDTLTAGFGFAPSEIDQSASTRAARLKWVILINETLPPGRAVNAAICVAAATSSAVSGLLGDDAVDADGNPHPGLPWAGCSILTADAETMRTIRVKGAAHPEMFVADMPAAAQNTRVYSEYLATVGETGSEEIEYYALSLFGPRNRVDRLVGRLPLMP
jgi:hypothetical protein